MEIEGHVDDLHVEEIDPGELFLGDEDKEVHYRGRDLFGYELDDTVDARYRNQCCRLDCRKQTLALGSGEAEIENMPVPSAIVVDVGDRGRLFSDFDDARSQPADHQAAALESALVADLA